MFDYAQNLTLFNAESNIERLLPFDLLCGELLNLVFVVLFMSRVTLGLTPELKILTFLLRRVEFGVTVSWLHVYVWKEKLCPIWSLQTQHFCVHVMS